MHSKSKVQCPSGTALLTVIFSGASPESYIAPSARLCPPFGRVMFCTLRAQSLGVPAVRAHFYRWDAPRRRFAPQAHTAAAPRNSIPLSTLLTAKNRITKPKSSTRRMLLFAVYIIRSIILLRKSCRFQSIISERKLSPSVFVSVIPNISSIVFDSSA